MDLAENISNIRSLLLLALPLAALGGCGYEGDTDYSPFKPKLTKTVLSFASKIQLQQHKVLPGSYIVMFKSQVKTKAQSSYFQEYQQGFAELRGDFFSDPRVEDIRFLTKIDLGTLYEKDKIWNSSPPQTLKKFWMKNEGRHGYGNITEVNFHSPEEAVQALKEWQSAGAIWYAEPNHFAAVNTADFRSLATSIEGSGLDHLNQIKLPAAFNYMVSQGKTYAELNNDGPVIAVLDSGVDYLHPSLVNRIYKPASQGASGCANDEFGCNTTQSDRGVLGDGKVFPFGTSGPNEACPTDENGQKDANCGHGTHVAGLIAAEYDTSLGVSGSCPVCRILPIKILGKTKFSKSPPGIQDSSIIAAFEYIMNFVQTGSSKAGIPVANMSFGKYQRSRTVGLLVRLLANIRGGTLLVGAASNEDSMGMAYPAAFDDAIAVAAVNGQGHKATFSNFGKWVDISAPGRSIPSSYPQGTKAATSGTSMAAPIVAGVAGLVFAANDGDISHGGLKDALLLTANTSIYQDDLNLAYYPKFADSVFPIPLLGYGLIDAEAAVKNQRSEQLPIFAGNNRVNIGCATLNQTKSAPYSESALLILLLLPLFYSVLRSALKSHRNSRDISIAP